MKKDLFNNYIITFSFTAVFVISCFVTQNIMEQLVLIFFFIICLLLVLAITNNYQAKNQKRAQELEHATLQRRYKKQKYRNEQLKFMQELLHNQKMNKLHEEALAQEIKQNPSSALVHIRKVHYSADWKVSDMFTSETTSFAEKKLK